MSGRTSVKFWLFNTVTITCSLYIRLLALSRWPQIDRPRPCGLLRCIVTVTQAQLLLSTSASSYRATRAAAGQGSRSIFHQIQQCTPWHCQRPGQLQGAFCNHHSTQNDGTARPAVEVCWQAERCRKANALGAVHWKCAVLLS
jgi:hypothetical protein